MSRMNKISTSLIMLCLLASLLASLLAAIMPHADFDGDGWFDSIITDGLLLIPALLGVTGLCCLFTLRPSAAMPHPYLLTSRLLPPPITR